MSLPSKEELEALTQILPSLTHYQVLKIGSLASDEEIQNAYHREAYQFHPDRFFGFNDPVLSGYAKKLYGRIVEAYTTLSQKEKRLTYDQGLKKSPAGPAVSAPRPDDNRETAPQKKPNTSPNSPGIRFLKLAQTAFKAGDLTSAKMNIQIALNSDPHDPDIVHLNQRIETELSKKKSSATKSGR